MTYVSEETAENVLSKELASMTLITKWNYYNQLDNLYLRSKNTKLRKPDILIHNGVKSKI